MYAMYRSLHQRDLGLLIIRAAVGFVAVYHGAGKLFGGIPRFTEALEKLSVPMPTLSAYLASLSEFLGGIALIFGLLMRFASIPFIFTMAVGFFVAHKGVWDAEKGGGEYALTLGLVTLGLVFTGAGRWSIDGAIAHKTALLHAHHA